ncbi:hypothetical protein [Luteolibacter marinus]|uniref:hypothetical protein n=1 Tax=Luteolibacter marinus TaxID=2776705 RepID=UPI0018670BF0|nr:hypothetical protein [Luteolibacter marinus]
MSARSTLNAFLDAPDWKSRRTYVLDPEGVGPAMEARAAELGDGPIETTSIRFAGVDGVNYFYQVYTPGMPEGIPISLLGTDEGPMIDWESFVGFLDDHFRKFIEGPADRHAILDLFVKPGDESGLFFRYHLSVPMPGRECDAFIRKDSVAFARLRSVFDGSGGYDLETVNRMTASNGLPLVLALVKRETNDGRTFIEIEDFVAAGWAPPAP